MINMFNFDELLIFILPSELLFNSWLIRKIHSETDLENKLRKKIVFSYSITHIVVGIIVGSLITWVYIALQLLHLAVYDYFILFILIILILNLIRQIVKTEKQFKRYSGHYSIKPPEGFYD